MIKSSQIAHKQSETGSVHLYGSVALRRFPYPYQAALAICSDVDETESTEHFLAIQRFLNTREMTSMGEGVGLEIGNSFYPYDDDRHFSYFTHDEAARQVIVALIRAGYIDCLHSYGDAVKGRDEIRRALEVLRDQECCLDVWVNHNGSPSNMGSKFAYMYDRSPTLGDDACSPMYHADVTLDYGIRYVWLGAVTRIIGQEAAATSRLGSLATSWDARYPLRTGLNLAKEIRKMTLGWRGDERFGLHERNELTQVTTLGDGRRAHEFMRYTGHPDKVIEASTGPGLAYMISPPILRRLVERQGYMIIYTHLGKNGGSSHAIPPATQNALRNLAREQREGRVYVTTTSRLLNYHRAHQHLAWAYTDTGGETEIKIVHIADPIWGPIVPTPASLQGLTFYVPDSMRANIILAGQKVAGLQRNPADASGAESITIPFVPMHFPC